MNPPALKPLPAEEDGCVLTMQDFLWSARHGILTEWDGSGYLATTSGESDVPVNFAHAWSHTEHPPEWATHVVWYNK